MSEPEVVEDTGDGVEDAPVDAEPSPTAPEEGVEDEVSPKPNDGVDEPVQPEAPAEDLEPAAPFAGVAHDSPEPAAAICEAFASRDSAAVAELMADDAIAVDHNTGVVYSGIDEIRAWIDEDPGFALYERMECAPADMAIASHFWSAGTYRFYSDTNPGGTEGIGAVLTVNGRAQRFDVLYSVSPADTEVSDEVSETDRSTVKEFCESWWTFDAEQIMALTTDDLATTPTGEARRDRDRVEPVVGVRDIEGALGFLEPVDSVECTDTVIANGGWIAYPARFPRAGDDVSLGGIVAVQLEEGLVSAQTILMDIMESGRLVFWN